MLPHCRKKFFGASPDAPSSNEILGSPGGSPSQTPNKFVAQKIRHQPLAKASGMVDFGDALKPLMLRTSVRS